MDAGYSYQWSAQDALGLAPTLPAGGSYVPPDMPAYGYDTTPPIAPVQALVESQQQFASDSFAAFHGPIALAGSPYQMRQVTPDPSPVVLGDKFYRPQYVPLSQVAFAAYDATHRTWKSLFHPLPVTADRTPRPDWNIYQTLQNWPMKAVSGLRITIYGGPQAPSPKGSAT